MILLPLGYGQNGDFSVLAGTIQLKVVEESASKWEQASCLFIGSEGKRTEEFMVAFSSERALREAHQGQARCPTYLNCIVPA